MYNLDLINPFLEKCLEINSSISPVFVVFLGITKVFIQLEYFAEYYDLF
jgi:hypothetical protein